MLHTPYGISLHTVAMALNPAKLISAVGRQSIQTGSEITNEVTAGSPYPKHVAVNAQKPQATASTMDLRAALDLVGSEGVAITSDGTHNGLDFWQVALDSGTGLPQSGAVHRRLNIPKGLLVPGRLSVPNQGDATLDLTAYAISTSAGAEPMTPYSSVAAPTGLAGDERFTIASATVGGILLDCTQQIDLDFGIRVETEACNSDIWDKHLAIAAIQPTITIRGKHVAKFAGAGGIPLIGTSGTHANTKIVLRKRSQSFAGFVANATAEHILITTAGLATWETVHDVSNNGRAELALRITSLHDGTNVPIVLDTAYAIP